MSNTKYVPLIPTSAPTLDARLRDPNVPKTELEHHAARAIERLEARIAELEGALQDIMDMRENLTWGHSREIARKALGKGSNDET